MARRPRPTSDNASPDHSEVELLSGFARDLRLMPKGWWDLECASWREREKLEGTLTRRLPAVRVAVARAGVPSKGPFKDVASHDYLEHALDSGVRGQVLRILETAIGVLENDLAPAPNAPVTKMNPSSGAHPELADDSPSASSPSASARATPQEELMAKKNEYEPLSPPQVPPNAGVELLNAQISKGEALLAARPIAGDEYSTWELLTKNYLEKAFGRNAPNVASITSVGKYGSFPMQAGEAWWENHRAESLRTQLAKLKALAQLLNTEVVLQEGGVATSQKPHPRHKVFLVHGHDELALHETARFLEKLHQEVIILRELPNKGRTIIEKFEDYSEVGFAVVLLTPDDRGGPASAAHEHQKPRARQNAMFELGYFIGKLGRSRVCALHRGGVELPSDYDGVVYVALDDKGAWRLELAKELRAAGLPVDVNNAL